MKARYERKNVKQVIITLDEQEAGQLDFLLEELLEVKEDMEESKDVTFLTTLRYILGVSKIMFTRR